MDVLEYIFTDSPGHCRRVPSDLVLVLHRHHLVGARGIALGAAPIEYKPSGD